MNPVQVLPITSAIIILLFAASVLRRYARRRASHLLLWGIGLAMFGVGSLAEAYSTLAWNPVVFRLWYLTGAVLNAAWLGQGTVFLLSRRKRWARATLWVLVAASLAATYLVFVTPLNPSRFSVRQTLGAQYRDILPKGATVRKLTPIFNIYGTLMLVGGALYSAWLLWRKQIVPNRVIGNILIAVGALSIASASSLVRLGLGDYLYLGELLAAALMFAGFLVATGKAPAPVGEGAPA